MAFYDNATLIMTTSGHITAALTTAGRPASPVTGQMIYNTSTNVLELYDQNQWKNVIIPGGGAFLYRQIITAGFVMGGYQSSSPWRNVNKMTHATDVCINLGDLLATAAVYTSGACSQTRGYVWTGGTYSAGVGLTTGINLWNETGYTVGVGPNTSRDDMGTIFKETQYAYITGTSSSVDVFTFSTETFSSGAVSGQTGDSAYAYAVSAWSDETVGYWWGSSGQKMTFASGTSYTIGTAAGVQTNGQQKGISSKLGKGYMGNEGNYNGGYNLRKYISSTDSYTTVSKPVGNSGEENFDMGQSWQYMMGMYDGSQNNRGWKFTYATDSGFELGAGSISTGVPGRSSGHCVWR